MMKMMIFAFIIRFWTSRTWGKDGKQAINEQGTKRLQLELQQRGRKKVKKKRKNVPNLLGMATRERERKKSRGDAACTGHSIYGTKGGG